MRQRKPTGIIANASMTWHGRLGVPYQGSKNQIAREIIGILPRGKRFVDLFAGGCAMTHAAILSGKYETFLANDLHGFGVRLFRDAIAGKCNGKWREWVSREEFFEKRDTDPLISLCWSFGNNGRTYLYAKEKESIKKSTHDRLLANSKSCTQAESIERMQSSERLESIQRLQSLEQLESIERLQSSSQLSLANRLKFEFGNYEDYQYEDGDVVYCDPPYAHTYKYKTGQFDSDKFWKWVDERDYPVFVSEYNAPDGFSPIWSKGKCQLMNGKGASGKIAERVFVANRYEKEFQTDLLFSARMTNINHWQNESSK